MSTAAFLSRPTTWSVPPKKTPAPSRLSGSTHSEVCPQNSPVFPKTEVCPQRATSWTWSVPKIRVRAVPPGSDEGAARTKRPVVCPRKCPPLRSSHGPQRGLSPQKMASPVQTIRAHPFRGLSPRFPGFPENGGLSPASAQPPGRGLSPKFGSGHPDSHPEMPPCGQCERLPLNCSA